MLVSAVLTLTSCANDDNSDKGGSEAVLEHLEGLDFDGADVNFIIAEADGDDFHYRSIYVDEDMADDAVNTALYQRNQKVQDMLNVNIVVDDGAHQDKNIISWIGSNLQAGDDSYDVIAARQYDDIQLALKGCMIDLNNLADYGADYLKWDQEYWATSYIDALSFGGKTFWITGDLCLRFTGGYYAIFVNTDLYNDVLAPEYGSIYDIVRNGNWTYDMLIEMASKSYVDDGNDKLDVSDQLGLVYPVWDNTNGLAISAGVMFTRYTDDGTPTNNVTAGNSTLVKFMDKVYELLHTSGVYSFNPPSCSYEEAMRYFASGDVMFVAGRLNQAELYLQEMERYYVIPCPKLDAEQESYYTGVHDAINIYGINFNVDDERVAAAAATLEAMAYYSFYEVRPIYYDSFLKFKYTRDSEAAEMIDIMHNSVYTDFVFIWQFTDEMNRLGYFLRENVNGGKSSSAIKRYSDTWTKGLEKILDQIGQLD